MVVAVAVCAGGQSSEAIEIDLSLERCELGLAEIPVVKLEEKDCK